MHACIRKQKKYTTEDAQDRYVKIDAYQMETTITNLDYCLFVHKEEVDSLVYVLFTR